MKTPTLCRSAFTILMAGTFASVGLADTFPSEVEKPTDFPRRPVTIISPFGPGGGSDQVARAMAREWAELIGMPFQVVNQPGAGGLTALPEFMIAPADGYTILQHTESPVTAFAAGRVAERPGEDLVPICITQVAFSMFFINPRNTNYQDWESLVAYARSSGEPLRVATSSGTGSHEHVSIVQTAEAAGIELEIIPFGAPGERYSALFGQHVDLLFDQPGHLMAYVEAGDLQPVLQLLPERPEDEVLGQVPALSDFGYDFEPTFKTRGFYYRKGVPENRLRYMEWICASAYQTERYLDFNVESFTHLVRSYYNTADATELTNVMIETFSDMYDKLGIR